MTCDVFLLPTAKQDISDAQAFYERLSPGLGRYCVDSLLADIDSLVFYAGIHHCYFEHYRLLSRRFPYAIYYQIPFSREVVVVAVLHTRKDPAAHGHRLLGNE